jgi:hypothetical protein
MKANNIEEFFGTLQQATVEAWKEHLKTDKYSKHIALNEFYEDIVELVDTLIEDYMGIYGKVSDYKNIMTTEKIGAVEYLESLREMCKEAADDLFDDDNDSELLSDVDNILSLIDSTLYKLKELKENSGMKSLSEYIKESLLNEGKGKYYIWQEFDTWKGTNEKNKNARIKNAREIQDFIGFDGDPAEEVIDYIKKYFPGVDEVIVLDKMP